MRVDYLKRMLTTHVDDVARETGLEPAPGLSARTGCSVLLKREDTQPVFSFKLRGAYNKMAGLSVLELKRGVIAASADNHARGIALSAARLGCKAVSAAIKRYHEEAKTTANHALVHWSVELCLYRVQEALHGVLKNLPNRPAAVLLDVLIFPLGARFRPPHCRSKPGCAMQCAPAILIAHADTCSMTSASPLA